MKIGIITKEKQHFILSLSSTTTLLVRSPVHFRPVRCVVVVAVAFVKGVHAVTFLFTFSFRVNLQKFIYTFRFFSPFILFPHCERSSKQFETNLLLSCLSRVSLCTEKNEEKKLIRWGSKETKTYYKVSYFVAPGFVVFVIFTFSFILSFDIKNIT